MFGGNLAYFGGNFWKKFPKRTEDWQNPEPEFKNFSSHPFSGTNCYARRPEFYMQSQKESTTCIYLLEIALDHICAEFRWNIPTEFTMHHHPKRGQCRACHVSTEHCLKPRPPTKGHVRQIKAMCEAKYASCQARWVDKIWSMHVLCTTDVNIWQFLASALGISSQNTTSFNLNNANILKWCKFNELSNISSFKLNIWISHPHSLRLRAWSVRWSFFSLQTTRPSTVQSA